MSKIKVKRKSVSLDMTAMCDVAFLLLTFFMLTTQFREDEAVTVNQPSSISEIPIPDSDILTLTVSKEGKVFFGVDRQPTRSKMLEKMGAQYKVTFDDREKASMQKVSSFGVPMNQLKQFLSKSKEERDKITQPGIPLDSIDTNNELKDWIHSARIANQEVSGKSLRIAIKGDEEANAPVVKLIISTLQKQEINKFNFITDAETPPAGLTNRKSHF
jgi:biopolymer transport protein ExbD